MPICNVELEDGRILNINEIVLVDLLTEVEDAPISCLVRLKHGEEIVISQNDREGIRKWFTKSFSQIAVDQENHERAQRQQQLAQQAPIIDPRILRSKK